MLTTVLHASLLHRARRYAVAMDQTANQDRTRQRTLSLLVFGAACFIAFIATLVGDSIAAKEVSGRSDFAVAFTVSGLFVFTFCFVWPVLTYIQLLCSMKLRAFSRLRMWFAIPIFLFGLQGDGSLVMDLYNNSDIGRQRQQQKLGRIEDQLAVNIDLFKEPLDSSQLNALRQFLQDRHIDPQAATEAARHYSHSSIVLYSLARVPSAPPECLRAIYEESLSLARSISGGEIPTDEAYRNPAFSAVGSHPNTPLDVLEDMLNAHDGHLGICAFRNPKLPKPEKIAFLERMTLSPLGSERMLAAEDPDTPPSALRRLATDRDLRVIDGLFHNPNTPEDVFEGFTRLERLEGWQGGIESFHKRAETELAKRRRSHAPANRLP